MRQAPELLAQYAAYHRDERNIVTHLIGIPIIIFAIAVLAARPAFEVAGYDVSPAWLLFVGSALWWLTRGDLALGFATSVAAFVLVALAQPVGTASVASWLGFGLGLFLLGWAIQFLGHWYEGRKPAFVDDVPGLLIGPLFVTAEIMFHLGWNKPLLQEIERRAGPTHVRNMHPA